MACFIIDFENVNSSGIQGITSLTEDDTVFIFYTTKANSLTFAAHMDIMKSKARVEYFPVTSGGRNALDFQLATYLGYCVCRSTEKEYYIISNDTGFDFVKNFWNGREESGNVGILRTSTIKKAIDDIRARNMENELVRDELIHEAYVMSTAAETAIPVIVPENTETDKTAADDNLVCAEKSFDYIAAAEAEMVYDLPEVPVMPTKTPVPPVPQLVNTRIAEEEKLKNTPVVKPENTESDKPAEIQNKAADNTARSAPNKNNDKTNNTANDKAVKKILELAAGEATADEASKISSFIKKSTGKQEFYRSLIKLYGMEHGGNIYRKIRPEFNNLTKLCSV